MGTKSIKYEMEVSTTEIQPLCEALNNFFASVEGDCDAFEFENIKKAEITIKKHNDAYKFKAKLTPIEPCEKECLAPEAESPEECGDDENGKDDGGSEDDGDSSDECSSVSEDNKPRYKALKKRMDKDFDIIKKSVKAAELPPSETVQRFMEDSDMMCRFQDKGEKYYEIYLAECCEFQNAVEAKNLEDIDTHVQRLKVLKKSCHKKYK